MKLHDVRKLFIEYFKSKGHTEVASAPLIPHNDPTLLFTNAGMVQFKNVFLGSEKKNYTRAVSCQKCVRAGGKHNDLEQVGHTARHHTFFEMLGNFSFGDYFKEEAIEYAWEFVTKKLKLPLDRLTVTVFEKDDEAHNIWHGTMGLPENKIYRFGEKDNFWSMAETGPCGPCTEIFYDMGSGVGCKKTTCKTGCPCDRFVEIWNLVFMQYNRDEKGTLTSLPRPCVDTGMGLERTAAALQGVVSNYDTDHFKKLFKTIEKVTHVKYSTKTKTKLAFRVVADHIRAITFLIGDGVLPSNEGRGYVLRRIMRRAIRFGRELHQKKPFLFKISEQLILLMQDAYPDLKDKKNFIEKIILTEEEKFLETLEKGLSIFTSHIHELRTERQKQVPGSVVFKLYDTYGFPPDLTRILSEEEEMTIDEQGFEELMKIQRERAKASWKASPKFKEIYKKIGEKNIKCKFEGYKTLETQSNLLYIIKGNELARSAEAGAHVELVFDKTPFYAEAGGQVGDKGLISKKNVLIEIEDTFSPLDGVIAHKGIIKKGSVKPHQKFDLCVNRDARHRTALNHTATHLLHHVLRKVLGEHVKQAGSLVEPERLRFDYTHFKAVDPIEIEKIESLINERILENNKTVTDIINYQDALKKGAMAIFEEKYGDRVRCVQLGNYSKELCGGTHASSTGDIKFFKIISDTAIGSGVRRMEAVTEKKAFDFMNEQYETVKKIATLLKSTSLKETLLKVEKLMIQNRELHKDLEKNQSKNLSQKTDELLSQLKNINNLSVLTAEVEGADPKILREYSDLLKQKIKSGIYVLGAKNGDKCFLIVGVTQDLTHKYQASEIIKKLVHDIGGSGGGRPDFAQAGGNNPQNLIKALNKIYEMI